MFEGRWRMKGNSTYSTMLEAIDGKLSLQELSVRIASLCRDFFEAGVELSRPQVGHTMVTVEDAASVSFEQWWSIYDKKVDRKKCIKKWEKLTYNEKQLCISATPAYVASTPDPAYRKNPLTYLNGECWNDEIIFKNNGTDKPTIEQQRKDKLADILTD